MDIHTKMNNNSEANEIKIPPSREILAESAQRVDDAQKAIFDFKMQRTQQSVSLPSAQQIPPPPPIAQHNNISNPWPPSINSHLPLQPMPQSPPQSAQYQQQEYAQLPYPSMSQLPPQLPQPHPQLPQPHPQLPQPHPQLPQPHPQLPQPHPQLPPHQMSLAAYPQNQAQVPYPNMPQQHSAPMHNFPTLSIIEGLHSVLERYRHIPYVYPDDLRQATINEISKLRAYQQRLGGIPMNARHMVETVFSEVIMPYFQRGE